LDWPKQKQEQRPKPTEEHTKSVAKILGLTGNRENPIKDSLNSTTKSKAIFFIRIEQDLQVTVLLPHFIIRMKF
jgi:hypothetical protein